MRKVAARPCLCCTSEHRHAIEIGLVHLVPMSALAAKFGISKDSIYRHSQNHLSPQMRASILAAEPRTDAIDLDELRTRESEGLLSNLIAQRARILVKGEKALELGDVKASIAAEGAYGSSLMLTAKLLGQLVQHHNVQHTSLLISPDYLRLRSALVIALKPYPEAARAVGSALHRLESEVAQDITAASKGRRARPEPVLIEHEPTMPPCPIPAPPC
jgi:hypothetical protein